MKGRKDDTGKRRWSLLPRDVLRGVVDVLMIGAAHYDDNNWMHVENGLQRYSDAFERHYDAWVDGQEHDPDSGLHHGYHMVCNAMFMCYHMVKTERVWNEQTDTNQTRHSKTSPLYWPE